MLQMIQKAQPAQGDVHVNAPLTQISLAFLQRQDLFVADRVFQNIPVSKQSDLYFKFDRGHFLRNQMAKRAPGAESQGIGYGVATDSYFADVWAIHHDLPDQVVANADAALNPDRESTELLMAQAMINRESQWVTNFFALSKWATDVTGVASAPSASQFIFWSDYSTSDPIGDIDKGKRTVAGSTSYEPNVLVLDRLTWGKLKDHPQIVNRLNQGQTPVGPALATLQSVAAILELDRILVSKAVRNTAIEGAANAISFIAGDNALLAYVPPSPGLMTPAAGYTFSWNGYLGAAAAGQRVSRFRMEHLRSNRIELEMAYAQKLVAAELGYFFSNTLA